MFFFLRDDMYLGCLKRIEVDYEYRLVDPGLREDIIVPGFGPLG